MSNKTKVSLYILLYFTVNLLFLTSFPAVHSDEPWLSGLTRAFINTGGISATEPFFNLFPRNPHALKTVFHLIQVPFILTLGYNVFAVRLVSLLFSAAALAVIYKITNRLTENPKTALVATLAASLDIQFIYASHFARQEIIILFASLLAFYMLLSGKTARAAIITGISIGVHPNAFLIAAMCGAVLINNSLINNGLLNRKTESRRELVKYTAISACFCAVFVSLSLSLDKNFFHNYFSYGKNFGVDASLWDKLRELAPYLGRIYDGVGGTYYIPDIRPQLVVLAPAAFISLAVKWKSLPQARSLATAVLGILAGLVLVGRYSQLYIVFIFPFIYMLFSVAHGVKRTLLLALTVFFLTGTQLITVLPQTHNKYDAYIGEIGKHVPQNAVSLCNLNAEYYFEYGALIDYRNLAYMRENGLSFAQYIYEYGIEYIVLSDEMELIYRSRPKLNAVYGNLYYHNEMNEFLESDCTLIHSFNDPLYGMRLVGYQGLTDCNVKIYKVIR